MLKTGRKPKDFQRDEQGHIQMTKDNLRLICEREEGCYEIPNLNDKIYLHFKGFNHIANLDEYTSLKSIWLDNNCLRNIENLTPLTKLICLFLQNNMIEEITGLDSLKNLQILNLSHNKIIKVAGLNQLTNLNNLDLSFNHLASADAISHLAEVPTLTNMDLSSNYFEYHIDYLEIFQKLPNLACLYLRNMALTRETPNYRKSYISHLKNLKYLDDRPIEYDERRTAEAWGSGGKEAEAEVRRLLNEEKLNNQKKVAEEYRLKSEENRQKRLFLYDKTLKEYEIELERLKEVKNQAVLQKKSEYYCNMFQEDIELQQNKIKDLTESIDNLSLFKPDPYKIYSTSRTENGDVIVWNKSREEAQFIKENLIPEEKPRILNKEPNIENQENNLEEIIEQSEENKEENQEIQGKNAWEVLKEGCEEMNREKMYKDWDNEYDSLLEALLEKFKFDFGKVKEEFNRVVCDVEKKLGKENKKVFEEKELRMRWTEKERTLRGGKKNEIIDLEDLD